MAGRKPRNLRDAAHLRGVPPVPPPEPQPMLPSPARIKVLAQAIILRVLENPAMPDHLRSPLFRPSLDAWARTEAGLQMIYDWMSDQIEQGGTGAMMVPPMPGTKAPMETWMLLERSAATLRSKLGMDPVSYAKIARDLGLGSKNEQDRLERMAEQGAGIVARAELESGVAEAEVIDPDGGV